MLKQRGTATDIHRISNGFLETNVPYFLSKVKKRKLMDEVHLLNITNFISDRQTPEETGHITLNYRWL